MNPLEMGGNIAKSIPGVQGAMQGADWMNQNVVDPASAQLKQLMAAIAQLMGGQGGQPQMGQPGPGGIQGGGFGSGLASGLRGAMIGGQGQGGLINPRDAKPRSSDSRKLPNGQIELSPFLQGMMGTARGY